MDKKVSKGKSDNVEYGFCTGFFGDGYVTHKFHSDENNKWDDEWDYEIISCKRNELELPFENYEGFVSNCEDVVTIHIKEDSKIPIDDIIKWFGLEKKHGVKAVLVDKFKDWK